MDPASHDTKIAHPIPLGGGEIWGQSFEFDPKFLRQGAPPFQILHRWKARIKFYINLTI